MNQARLVLIGVVIGSVIMFTLVSFWPQAQGLFRFGQEKSRMVDGQAMPVCLHEPDISVSYPERDESDVPTEPESTLFTVKNGDVVFQEFTLAGPRIAEIMKQIDCVVYFRASTTGLGGYILYGASKDPWYKVDLNDKTVVQLSVPNFLAIEDISPDQSTIVASDVERHAIVLLESTGKELQRFSVPEMYGQFGDVLFSPNGKKIAYAAAVGNPEEEQGSVFIIDLLTGETIDGASKLNGSFSLAPWRDNQSPTVIEH